jgi:tetratricopeptide (TPR) repeat protein
MAQVQPKEPNKNSIEHFKNAMDTIRSANEQNADQRQKIAIDLFSKSISADSKNVPAYLWKSMLLLNSKKYKDALATITTGISASKANANVLLPQMYMNMGGTYLLMNDKKKSKSAYYDAIKAYKEVLKESKCNLDAIANIAIIYAIVEEKKKAIQFIDNNKTCFKELKIDDFKKHINEFDINKYLEEMKKKK